MAFGVGDNDPIISTNYVNQPIWTELPSGMIPTGQFSTYKRTKFITAMVAGDNGAFTQTPQETSYPINISDSPAGGWVISPNETIPCRGYLATNCSLAVRVRQMLELELNDEGGTTNNGTIFADTSDTHNAVHAATPEVGGEGGGSIINGTNASIGVSTNKFYQSNQSKQPGPFKMSDFRNASHFGIDSTEFEFNGVNNITYSISTGLKMEGGSGPIHLGGDNTQNPLVSAPNPNVGEI